MVQSGGRVVLRVIGGSGDDGFFKKEREAEALLKSIVASVQFPFR